MIAMADVAVPLDISPLPRNPSATHETTVKRSGYEMGALRAKESCNRDCAMASIIALAAARDCLCSSVEGLSVASVACRARMLRSAASKLRAAKSAELKSDPQT